MYSSAMVFLAKCHMEQPSVRVDKDYSTYCILRDFVLKALNKNDNSKHRCRTTLASATLH